VKDEIHLLRQEEVVGDIIVHEAEVRVARVMGDVRRVAGDQVVHRGDAPAFGQQPVAQMRSQKTGPSRDKSVSFHSILPDFSSRRMRHRAWYRKQREKASGEPRPKLTGRPHRRELRR
jgi:hypothetical protein